jgi:uncharacterized protein GlcG (DUF336 family)
MAQEPIFPGEGGMLIFKDGRPIGAIGDDEADALVRAAVSG